VNGTHDQIDGQGIGDLGLHVKARLAHVGPLGFGAIASVYLPTASPKDRFLGEPQVTPQLVGVIDLGLGRLRLAGNAGIRLRPTTTFTDTMMGTMGSITTSTELPLGVGAAFALSPEKVELVGEVFGALPIGAHHGYQPLEALGGLKVYLAKSSYLAFGAGRGLTDQAGSPDLRAVISIVFEPKPAAHVVDHVEDDHVVVATAPPVSRDEFHDRDNDGIRDEDDKCPDDPETYNGYQDEDGCPDQDVAIDSGSEIEILKSIDFEFDKAVLRPTAPPILDAVAHMMVQNPAIVLVEVQGHTDEQGDDAYNLELSNRRAHTVQEYLVAHGVARERLRAEGYGESRPLDKAHTQAAYAKNRRVEFHILSRTDR
jgi:outer membrane protein OmpA-like peptidoglycan-associated protein